MQEISPESPEERRKHPAHHRALSRIGPGTRVWEVTRRIVIGVYSDGFIHAGNLAYLALLTLFPFFIVTAALASILGRSGDSMLAVTSFLQTLPPSVAELLAKPIADVLGARTGGLLWLGGLVGLWTVGSFVETIRDIMRRAYGVAYTQAFWRYRVASVTITIGSVILVLLAFSAQVVLTAAEQFVLRLLPFAQDVAGWIGLSRLLPPVVMFGALYALFLTLTPSRYRFGGCPVWPGALFTALWWSASTALLPLALAGLGSYDLTYGSLAGVIIALFFFWLVGFGIVIGAHVNAALAEPPEATLKEAASA